MAVATSLLALVASSCAADPSESTATANFHVPGVAAVMPIGWSATRQPLSRLMDPRPLLTAASYELVGIAAKGSCSPAAALIRKPPEGALVVVSRYRLAARHSLRKLSRRPESLALGPRTYNNFDCGGRKYNINFREGSRGYRFEVWLDRRTVDPQVLADTRSLLNSLELSPTE